MSNTKKVVEKVTANQFLIQNFLEDLLIEGPARTIYLWFIRGKELKLPEYFWYLFRLFTVA